jgi:hypothetical protein
VAQSARQTVPVLDVVIDEALYPRSGLNEFLVNRLIGSLEAGAVFPPIVIERVTNRLVDGRHRLEVHRRKEIADIAAESRVYNSEADLFAEAVRINAEHGQPLTHYDLKDSILRLERMGYSRDKISVAVKMTPDKVADIIRNSAHSETGEPVALKGGLRHMRGQSLNDAQAATVKRYAGGQAVFYVKQLLMLLDNNLWPTESPSIRTEMDKLVDRWLARYPRDEAAA